MDYETEGQESDGRVAQGEGRQGPPHHRGRAGLELVIPRAVGSH